MNKVEQLPCNIPGARKTAVIHDQVINRLYSDSSSTPSEGLPIDDSAPTFSVDLSLVKAKRQLKDLPGPQNFCRWIECKLASESIAQRYIAHMKEGHQRIVLKVKVQHRKHHRKKQKEERRQKRDNLGYQTVLQGHERMGQNLQLLSQFYNVDKVQFKQQHGWNWTRRLMGDRFWVTTGTGAGEPQWDQWTQRPMGSWTLHSGVIGLWNMWRHWDA